MITVLRDRTVYNLCIKVRVLVYKRSPKRSYETTVNNIISRTKSWSMIAVLRDRTVYSVRSRSEPLSLNTVQRDRTVYSVVSKFESMSMKVVLRDRTVYSVVSMSESLSMKAVLRDRTVHSIEYLQQSVRRRFVWCRVCVPASVARTTAIFECWRTNCWQSHVWPQTANTYITTGFHTAMSLSQYYSIAWLDRIFLITNHQPLFHICFTLPVESAPFFIPSTSFCSLSSWFTSTCAYHLITVITFALITYHCLYLSLQT